MRLRKSEKHLKQGSRPWRSRSSKAKSRSKKKNAESKLPRKRQKRRKPSLRPSERSWRPQRRGRGNCNCSWRTLGTKTHLMKKVPRKPHHKRPRQQTARCYPEKVASSFHYRSQRLQSLKLLHVHLPFQYRVRRQPHQLRGELPRLPLVRIRRTRSSRK